MYAATANPQARYWQQGVMTASPIDLIIMLYDGAIKQLKIASIAIGAKDIEKANASLNQAQAIVMELINSLDLRYPIARDLLNLYEFILNEITQVNIEKSEARLPGLLNILDDLRGAWKTAAKEGAGGAALIDE